jgi:branched-chain amino acid transport system ATP-binding protein
MDEREPLLRVEEFSKSFGGVQALSHVSFDVHEGDVLGIIGPNGSGKTTLVNCITSFVKRDEGRLYFRGKELRRGMPPHKVADLGIARTFQITRPYYSLPAYKNLVIPLPTGYLKRLELARCLAIRPELVICDEIFSGLSGSEIATMTPLIEKLQMEGVTLIMIEHRLRELFRVANRVMVLNFGEKLIEGTAEEVIADEKVKEAYFGSDQEVMDYA